MIKRKYKRLAKKVIKKEGVKITEEDESDIATDVDRRCYSRDQNKLRQRFSTVCPLAGAEEVQLTSEQASDALAPTCYSVCTKSLLFLQSSLSKCYELWLSGSTFRINTEGLHSLVFCSQWCAVRVY